MRKALELEKRLRQEEQEAQTNRYPFLSSKEKYSFQNRNQMPSRHSRKMKRTKRKSTRRQRGGATMKISAAIKKLQDIQSKHGDLDFFRLENDHGSYLEDIRSIYYSDQGGEEKALLE